MTYRDVLALMWHLVDVTFNPPDWSIQHHGLEDIILKYELHQFWHFIQIDLNLKGKKVRSLLLWVLLCFWGFFFFFLLELQQIHTKWHCSSISHHTKKEDQTQRGDWVLFELAFQKFILKSVRVKTYGSCTIAENRMTQPISICGSYYMSEQPVNNENSLLRMSQCCI